MDQDRAIAIASDSASPEPDGTPAERRGSGLGNRSSKLPIWGFKTGALVLAKMGILQATLLLWGIGLLRDKFASNIGSFGS